MSVDASTHFKPSFTAERRKLLEILTGPRAPWWRRWIR
jgi:hypothetical protein